MKDTPPLAPPLAGLAGGGSLPWPLASSGQGGRGMRKKLTPAARRLRKELTDAEKVLWQELRLKRMGVKFRRQAVIDSYIVDFACFKKRLVIEIDGGQHCENQADIQRDEWLREQGFEVIRFWNNEVLGNLDGVYQKIEEHLNLPHPCPRLCEAIGFRYGEAGPPHKIGEGDHIVETLCKN